jgi:hypothetical protein
MRGALEGLESKRWNEWIPALAWVFWYPAAELKKNPRGPVASVQGFGVSVHID